MALEKEQLERRKKVLYDMICDRQYVPMKIKEIAVLLQIPRETRGELKEVLDALVLEGKIEITARGKYKKASARFLTGTFIAHPRGYGFVEIEGRETDIFIPEDQTGQAMHRDIVQVAVLSGAEGKRQEGSVIRILEHGITELVGTFQKSHSYGFVLPDNQRITKDIFIAQENSMGAVDGHKVLIELLSYGGKNRCPEGRVKEIIGHVNDPGTDILSVVYEYGLPTEFPERVMNQAQRAAETVSDADMEGRKDLRSVQMVTIDGEDAKDLDDAVSLTFDGEKYHLGVHIADVANYVQENSALDREARKRGTSVYLADRVIPMLPHRLSNGICSLNAGADRLALSCLMTIDGRGEVTDYEIAETVIRVDRRMSYTEVQAILENGQSRDASGGFACSESREKSGRFACGEDQEASGAVADGRESVIPMLFEMERLMRILRSRRKKRGAIDFNFAEAKVVLDEQGAPTAILPREANTATRIIEEFMLCANETVAGHFYWQEIPFVYRTHEAPDSEKIQSLASFLANFGYGMKGISDEIHPKELQKLLARIADTPQEMMISRLVLRSMKRAGYTTEAAGHFGLAARHYCHFTSPIRRYPDLQIHRIIKDVLRGRMQEERAEHYRTFLSETASDCSRLERRADEAERETVKMKKAEYMLNHIGEEYDAVISGMTSYGMYAELPNTVEGLIHVSRMYGDRYYYREDTYEMYGVDTGRVFRLGDTVRVRVADADKELRTVDFELAD